METRSTHEALKGLAALADELLADWTEGPIDDLIARLSSYSERRSALFTIVEQGLGTPTPHETALIRAVLERDAAIGQRIDRARGRGEAQLGDIRVRRKGINGYRAQVKPRSGYLKG